MHRFRLAISLTGFVVLAAIVVAPARGQMGMHKGGCQKNHGGGHGAGTPTPSGQGGGGFGFGLTTPVGQGGGGFGLTTPLGQRGAAQNPLGRFPAMQNPLGQNAGMQNPLNQGNALQQLQTQRALLQQMIYNETLMLQYYQQLLTQMQNGQSTSQSGASPGALSQIPQMPSFYAPTSNTNRTTSNQSYRSAVVRAQ